MSHHKNGGNLEVRLASGFLSKTKSIAMDACPPQEVRLRLGQLTPFHELVV